MTLLLHLKKNTTFSLVLPILGSSIFLSGCAPPASSAKQRHLTDQSLHSALPLTQVVGQDANWINKFTRDYFLESPTIFVVLGSKPMACTEIISASETDWQEALAPHLADKSESERQKALDALKKELATYDLDQTWNKWTKWHQQCKSSPFLFHRRQTQSPHIDLGYIINTREMAWTLYKNYETFQRELGQAFDPITVTLQFGKESLFWKRVFDNHLLQGIAFGYGERNAYFFSRDMAQNNQTQNLPIFKSEITSNLVETKPKSPFLSKIVCPDFRSYSFPNGKDPVVDLYRAELAEIHNQVNEENFSRIILSKFIQSAP